MAINVIVNDPRPGSPPQIISTPILRNHFAMKIRMAGDFPQREYDLSSETDGFLHWQCRQAALLALHAWKNADPSGSTLMTWHGGNPELLIRENAGHDLNAYYDRNSLSFFHFNHGDKTTYSGLSTDVVAHEVGHALLDAFRPDLWDAGFFEVAAFHEAAGDCSALMAAFEDPDVRLAPGVLDRFRANEGNLVETIAEDLSDGIKRFLKTLPADLQARLLNAASPRRAKNEFTRIEHSRLPRQGGKGELIDEVHSYSQIFTGCFYDLIVKIFSSKKRDPKRLNHKDLREAAHTAGHLLIEGVRYARARPQFFREVGQAMIFVDKHVFGGLHQVAIRDIFLRRDIQLFLEDTLPAEQSLDGPLPNFDAPKAADVLAQETKKDLTQRMGLEPGARLNYTVVSAIKSQPFVEVSHLRPVSLGAVDKRLDGVSGLAKETARVGALAGAPQVLGPLSNTVESTKDVHGFVEGLRDSDLIEFEGERRKNDPLQHTHSVTSAKTGKKLRRLRFSCCCNHWRS